MSKREKLYLAALAKLDKSPQNDDLPNSAPLRNKPNAEEEEKKHEEEAKSEHKPVEVEEEEEDSDSDGSFKVTVLYREDKIAQSMMQSMAQSRSNSQISPAKSSFKASVIEQIQEKSFAEADIADTEALL
jgi:hypothetical protein